MRRSVKFLLFCQALSCALSIDFNHPRCAFAYSPKSPEVQRLIKAGVDFLAASSDKRLGGKCLIALALIKADVPSNHPKIIEAIGECKAVIGDGINLRMEYEAIYNMGIATIFLTELDAEQYQPEIKALLGYLQKKQKNHGGWSYPEDDKVDTSMSKGDISMTQYGVLSAWTARQSGFKISNRSIEQVANWLMRTQDPSGAWGYQGIDPGHYGGVTQDSKVGLSMAAAGAGSLLMSAHLLGAIHIREEVTVEGIPSALRLTQSDRENEIDDSDPGNVQIDMARLRQSIQRANGWFESNYSLEEIAYKHYYLYALERYMSFRELAEGNAPAQSFWYNDGVEYLAKTQKSDGSWKGTLPAPIDTAFSVLFLLRSTRTSIRRAQGYGDELNGGRGLPGDVANVKLRHGRIVPDQFTRQADEFLKILSDPDHPDFENLLQSSQDIPLSTEGPVDDKQAAKLRQLISGGQPPVRRLAVRALARTRDLDYVPTLIYGLTDPDWTVVREARDGLRFISRKFAGFGIPDEKDNDRRLVAIRRWKQWYLTIRPDAMFDE